MKENWTYKKLGEVCDIYQPQTISTEMLVPDGEYLVYGANGVIGRYDKYNHTESEVLLTCRGATCGSINVSAPYSWINGNAMVIHPIDDSVFCSRSFLVYLMKSIDYSLVITGAAQPQITRQKLSPVKIAIPPRETQSRIVSELDLLQSIIDKQKAQLKELNNLAQAVFYDMFGDPVENEKGWEVKKLGEFCRIGTGSTPNRERKEYYGGHIPWVKTTEVCNCLINNTEEYLTQLGLDNSNCSLYPPDTILMAMYGQGKTRGQIAILGITATTNQACAAIQYDSNVVDKTFLFQQLLLL